MRLASADFLAPWEPRRGANYLSRGAFKHRVTSSKIAVRKRTSVGFMVIRAQDAQIVGGITLDNIQGGVAQFCTVGYWMGAKFTRQGYMQEALNACVRYGFEDLDISRIQAGCLPQNIPSRALLEKSGFVCEGVAKKYLQIAGQWRDHVLYATLRQDRAADTGEGDGAE